MNAVSPEFARELAQSQTIVYAYILTLLPDRTAAEDILQEVNLTALKKASSFEIGTSFSSWATKIAYFHILQYRRKAGRERQLLSEEVLMYLAERQSDRLDEIDRRTVALKACIEKLPRKQQAWLADRYAADGSVNQIAQSSGTTVACVSQTLYRIRCALSRCLETALLNEASP